MKAGRDLDRIVAEKVMGLTIVNEYQIPEYSSDISAAWLVVEKKETLFKLNYDYISDMWAANFKGSDSSYEMQADTAPHAICLAALKAVGVEV